MLISEAFACYRQDVIVFRNQSAKTEENHTVCMKSLVAFAGDIDIALLTFELVRDWKIHLDIGRSSETVRNYIIKLRVVLEYLRRSGRTSLDPELVRVPKRTDKVPSFLSSEDVQRCINATKRLKNKAIISLLYASGVRVSELCGLDRDQFHGDSFTVVGKGGRARLCFVDQRTITLCQLYLESRSDNNMALFLTDRNTRITPGTIQETFKTVRKQTGLNVHPHTMRHSFATNLLQNNTNLYYVSKMLGHAQLTTTQQYLHVIDHDLKKIYHKHHTV